jgi:hypothetical protein
LSSLRRLSVAERSSLTGEAALCIFLAINAFRLCLADDASSTGELCDCHRRLSCFLTQGGFCVGIVGMLCIAYSVRTLGSRLGARVRMAGMILYASTVCAAVVAIVNTYQMQDRPHATLDFIHASAATTAVALLSVGTIVLPAHRIGASTPALVSYTLSASVIAGVMNYALGSRHLRGANQFIVLGLLICWGIWIAATTRQVFARRGPDQQLAFSDCRRGRAKP